MIRHYIYIFLPWWYIPVLEYYNQVLEYNNQLLKYYSQTFIIRVTSDEYIFGLETADNTSRGADITDICSTDSIDCTSKKLGVLKFGGQ